MEQFPTGDNPENINQEPADVNGGDGTIEPFDREKAQQLRDEYTKNQTDKEQLAENFVEKYQTIEEARDALKNIEGQLYWGKALESLVGAISIPDATDTVPGGDPKWKALFTSSDVYPSRKGSYSVKAVVNDEYGKLAQNGNERIASPSNKRFLIEPEYGYTKTYSVDEEVIDVNGFCHMPRDGEFPEETDFTVGNKAGNRDISNRINDALYELFGKNEFSFEEKTILNNGEEFGLDYLDHVEYPDDAALKHACEELKGILGDIGDIDSLENKRSLLKNKVGIFKEAEEKAE